MFQRFQHTLIMNYIWGSGIAVFGVGGLFIFQTLDLSKTEMLILLAIMGLSGMMMIGLELLLYRRHIRPIRRVFQTETPTYEELQ